MLLANQRLDRCDKGTLNAHHSVGHSEKKRFIFNTGLGMSLFNNEEERRQTNWHEKR